jgi:hypothetical protein
VTYRRFFHLRKRNLLNRRSRKKQEKSMEKDLMAKIINSTAKLLEEFRISVDNGRFHCVCLDLPPELGTDKGEKPDDAKTVTKVDIEIEVTTNESEDKINRVWQHTRDNCPVGQLFEGAGVPVNYNLKIIKK